MRQQVHCVYGYAPSQWERTLHCNVISHWLGTYSKWSWDTPLICLFHDNPLIFRFVSQVYTRQMILLYIVVVMVIFYVVHVRVKMYLKILWWKIFVLPGQISSEDFDGSCHIAVILVLKHWSYCSFAPSLWFMPVSILRDEAEFFIQSRTVSLTHCHLVTPYEDRDLGQRWLS